MTLLTQYVVAFSVCLAMTLALPTPEDGKFGKRADADYVRFGKRADADYVRFGKRADADYVRFGKRADSDYVRFGKRTSDDSDDSGSSQDLLRLLQAIRDDQGSRPRRSPDSSYVRFGKRSNIRGITPYSGLISLSECSRYRDYAKSLEDMIFLLEEEKQCLLSKL